MFIHPIKIETWAVILLLYILLRTDNSKIEWLWEKACLDFLFDKSGVAYIQKLFWEFLRTI